MDVVVIAENEMDNERLTRKKDVLMPFTVKLNVLDGTAELCFYKRHLT